MLTLKSWTRTSDWCCARPIADLRHVESEIPFVAGTATASQPVACPQCAGLVCLWAGSLVGLRQAPETTKSASTCVAEAGCFCPTLRRKDRSRDRSRRSRQQCHPAPVPRTPESELTAQAEDILARYPGKNAVELLNVPEVNEKLRNGLKKLGDDPELGKRISPRVELAAKLKGLEGTPGSARLDLDIKSYDKARTTRMLETCSRRIPSALSAFSSRRSARPLPNSASVA